MKRSLRVTLALALVLAAISAIRAAAQRGDFLSDKEQEELRDAQDPGGRIEVYLDLEQARLARIEELQDHPSQVNSLLNEFISLNEEMKDWIEDQYDHHGDMRQGLRSLLDRGPRELDELRAIQQWPGAKSSEFADNLRDAIASVTDGLDGSTKALDSQQKMFGELKREEKAEARATKERIKEEKKRAKQEKKLREKMRRQSKSDSDQN
jgi:hypothetical protein